MNNHKYIFHLGILVLLLIISILVSIYYKKFKKNSDIINEIENIEIGKPIEDVTLSNIQSSQLLKDENIIGILEIPSINLKAPIASGTDDTTLKNYIGHFNHTPLQYGNIGLAGHNSGFLHNYFKDIHKLQKGDLIIYKTTAFTFQYEVERLIEIYENDWSYLDNTDANMLTLITCVKNKPHYRFCVKARLNN